jgi:hypothetical protein
MNRIAESVILKFCARWAMVITGALLPIAAGAFYTGQQKMQQSLDGIKLELARLSTTQQIAGENRDRSIASIDSRLTFLERQGHK